MSNGIDRSQILNQLRVILPPQEYEACVGLSDAELSEKLREALSNNSNMGVGDSFTRNFNAMPEILTPRQPQKPILPTLSVEAQIPQLTTEQAQDIAMQNLWAMNSDLARAQRELDRDKINESTSMLISREARGLYYLDRARSPQGLTKKEYLEGMKGDLRTMLITTFPDLEGRNINLDERLDSLDTEQIQMLQKALLTAEAGRLDKNEVLRMFADATQIVETVTFTTDGQTHTETRTKVKPPYSMSGGGEEKLSFEELYRVERGTDFNPDNIRQYLIDGTVSFFENPFENGFPSLEELEKHNQYQQHLPASYISSFGQPYRAEYLSVLKGSDYDTSTAYGVTPVKLDGQLTPSDEGMEFVIPTRDLTQGANVRELNPDELKRFSANMLYNILNTTYNMLKGYYDGAWEQLKSGSVGTAAVQGFLGFGELLSGQDLTVRSQMDNVEGLLAKAAQLKNMDDNAFEQHFDELFREISGTSFDPAAMQNFAQLTMKGIKTDTDEYSEAVTRAFGSNRTGDAETQFSILNPINSVVDVVAFLAGSEVLGSTKLFAQIGSKSLQLTTKAATRLGFNPASKGVQAGVRLISSSPVSAMNLMGYTAITETGGTVLSNLAEKYGLVKPQGEYISVMDSDRKEDDDLIRILVDMTKQGAMGSVAPFIGAFANKTGTKLATAFSKGNPSAIQRSFSAITEAEGKTLNAQTLMNNYLSSLDASALTKAQEVIAKSSGFLTEVAGFTGYSTLEHIAEGLLTGELDIESLDLGEEFKGQLEGLATLKGVARFIQMKKSGAVARGVQDKAIETITAKLKDYDIKEIDGHYRVTSKDGKFEILNTPEEVVTHLTKILFTPTVTQDRVATDEAISDTSAFENYQANSRQNGTNYELITDKNGNRMAVSVSSESSETIKKLNVTVFDKDGKVIEELKNVTETEIKTKYPDFYTDTAKRENIENVAQHNELPAPNPARRPHSTEPTLEDPFGFKGNFDAEILNLTGNDILVQIGVDKEGEPIKKISDEYEELIMDIARQIREVALSQEGGPKKIGDVDDPNYDYTQDKGIVGIMHRLGLTQNSQFFHRSKSVQSLHDKIQNALIQNPEKPLDALIGKEVRDAVGVRSVRESANLNNDKDIMALVNAGDRKSAIDLAIEKESAFVLDALKRYIDSVEAGTNEVEITSISNYMGEDGIPFFTERQLNELKVYAESKNVNLPIVQRVLSYTERAEGADVFREKATTKVRGSGYTALQMNFRTKDGFVYEWQYRGSSVNNFAEGEHIPYDLRTNKDIIGKNEELHDLFDPIKTLLSEENMSEPQFEEYNNYLTAHYEYLRLTELGFVDGKNPPKLPMGFDPRLRAENLELLHEKAEETKKHPKEKDRIYKEYTDEIARREQANPDNYTTDSYTELAEKKKASRTISKDEAEVRLGRNLDNSNPQDIAEIVEACRNSEGAISEYYIAEAESLLKIGLGKDDVLLYFKALKGPSTTVSTERTAPAEPKPQERTPEEFEAYIQTQRNLEAWAVNDLKALYEKNGVIVEEFFNQKTPDGKPRFSEWDIMYVFKRENKDFCINLLETTDINDNFKFDIDVLKRINKLLENNPHRAEINSYIEHHLLNNDDIDGNKIKLFVESLDNNSTETDFKVLSKILTDKTVPDNKKADIIASYKDLSPEQKTKLCDNYCNGNKTGFSDAFQITTGEKASGESQDIENLIKNTSALEGLSPYDIEELKECNFNQVKECIDTLEYFINKNPNASVRDRQYLLSLQKTALQQGVMLDTKSIIDNDLLNDVKLLESVIETPSAKDVNDAQYLRFKALAEIDYSDPETFRNNKKYILTSGLRTDTDVIGNMRNGIDYRKRQAELAGVKTDDITRAVLQGTKDITDIRGIERTVNQIKNILGEIRHPEIISDVLNRLNIQDYNEFNEFIKGIDIKELHRIAPRTREFNEKDLAVFLGFHYKNGTKEFNSNTLKTEKDLTEFLAKHYLDASSMSDMLAAYPLTDRNIGDMPAGWLTNVSGNQNIDKQVHNAIDDFRQTKNINTLKSTLSNLLHKNVNIEDLGSGVYGQGFKIEVEGSEPVVLKLFFETPDIGIERSLHGQTVETQTGLFLNHNSNRFVHTYFGRICGHSDHDGFMVTQYMDEGVTPVITAGNNNNYSITPTDVHKGHNEVNNIIFDLGGTLIKGKDGKNISFDVLKHKKDN